MKVTLSWLREFAPDIDGDPVRVAPAQRTWMEKNISEVEAGRLPWVVQPPMPGLTVQVTTRAENCGRCRWLTYASSPPWPR